MKLNLFEGGRRLTRLAQIGLAVFIIGYALLESPYGSDTLMIYSPKEEYLDQKYAAKKCSDDDLLVRITKDLPVTGIKELKLCFVAMKFSNERILIPYKMDEKTEMVWGDTKTSQNVTKYITARKKKIEKEPLNEIADDADWWGSKITFLVMAVVASLLASLIIECISKVVGWVVRGFMNVPSDSNHEGSETIKDLVSNKKLALTLKSH